MKRIIDTSEVLGTVDAPEGPCEVCVAADASLDEAVGKLVVKLDAFLRPTDLLAKERHFRAAAWLPKNDTVIIESVSQGESHEAALEIFHRWARKVREAAPQLHNV